MTKIEEKLWWKRVFMPTRKMILWLCISSKELGNHFIITLSYTASPLFESWNLVENNTRFQCSCQNSLCIITLSQSTLFIYISNQRVFESDESLLLACAAKLSSNITNIQENYGKHMQKWLNSTSKHENSPSCQQMLSRAGKSHCREVGITIAVRWS